MKFNIKDVQCRPENEGKRFYGCTYSVNGVDLFYERTWTGFPLNRPRDVHLTPGVIFYNAIQIIKHPVEDSEQWIGGGLSLSQAKAIVSRHPGANYREEYYRENEYFIWFQDTDKALAFCQTDDFDRYCLEDKSNSEQDTFIS